VLVRALVLLLVAVVCVPLVRDATLVGDGQEYFSVLESFWRHGTPEQRTEDVDAYVRLLAAHGFAITRPREGLFVTADGRWYSYHFWLYPLLCVPAKALLHLFRADEFRALALTNAALLLAAIANALRRASPERAAFVTLALVTPVLAYVRWPHGEVLTWACVLTSLVCIDERNYGRAALFAALGSLHAPPIAALALLAVALAANDPAPARRARVGRAVLGSGAALASPLFFLATFRVPSLIADVGMADARLVTPSRVAAFVVDLEYGLVAHAPVLVVAAAAGLVCALRRKQWRAHAFALTALAMLAGGATTTNMNGAEAGLHRYAVWVIPVLAWIAAAHVPWRALFAPRIRPLAATALAAAAAFQFSVVRFAAMHPTVDTSYAQSALARFTLEHAPTLYSPEPESFTERILHREAELAWHRGPLPVAFMTDRGARKILTDARGLDALPLRFDVDGPWLADVRARYGAREGRFYLEPPPGVVMPRGHGTSHVAFEDGWYDVERAGADCWRWMSKRASLVVRAAVGAQRAIRLRGWVPEELGTSPRVTVRVDGALVDQFTAPRHRFTREYVIPGGPRDAAKVEIETSDVVKPPGDARQLGFALLGAELTEAAETLGAGMAEFEGSAWLPAFDHPDGEVRCLAGPGTIRLPPQRGRADETLVLAFWLPNTSLGRRANLRVDLDGRVVHDGPVNTRLRRRLHARADQGHTIRIDPDEAVDSEVGHASACVEVLRYLP